MRKPKIKRPPIRPSQTLPPGLPAAPGTGSKRFDPAKMQYEAMRRRKRKHLLLWSIPSVILMLAVALWFLLPTPLTAKAIKNYKGQNYQSARDWLTPLTWTSPEPFVIAFNSGTVDTERAKYDLAQRELTRALELATPAQRCMVLQNLVISLNDHGASLENQPALPENPTTYLNEAAGLKAANPKCFPPPRPANKPGGGGGGGGASSQNPQILTAAQQQELQQKNQEGDQQEQPNGFQQNAVNPNNPTIKPW